MIYFNYQLILPYLWVIWRMFSSNTFWHSCFSSLCLRTSIEGHFSCRRSARYLDKCQGYFPFSFSFWLNGSYKWCVPAPLSYGCFGHGAGWWRRSSGCFGHCTGCFGHSGDVNQDGLNSGRKWCDLFLISDGQPELGSWLDAKQQPWGVGWQGNWGFQPFRFVFSDQDWPIAEKQFDETP